MLLDPFEHSYSDYDEGPQPVVFYETPKNVMRAGVGERLLPLTKGFEALIDAADYALLQGKKFYASKSRSNFYAKNSDIGYMHRIIVSAKDGWVVDHKNRNTMDCRRSNLKICGFNENAQNAEYEIATSGYRGVYKVGRKFRAQIRLDGTLKDMGRFEDAPRAARAYDLAALEHYGPHAWTNFDQEDVLREMCEAPF